MNDKIGISKDLISKDLSMVIDGLMLGGCLWIAYQLRISLPIKSDILSEIPPFSHFFWMLALIIPLCPLLLDLRGFYENPLSQRYDYLSVKIAQAGLWLFISLSICAIFARLDVPSRSVLVIFLLMAPAFLLLRVSITRKILHHNYKKGNLGERTILIGTIPDTEEFLSGLSPGEKLELQIIQRIDLFQISATSIRQAIRQHAAGRVIFTTPESPANEDLPFSCEEEGLDVWILSRSINGLLGVPSVHTAGKQRVLVFSDTRGDIWYRFAKRSVDIVGSLVGLLILSPVCLAVIIGIKLDSPGPVIFTQVRSGKRGRRFTILKFRTMIANAPELHADLAHRNEMEGPVFKIAKDPRVTTFGEFLRRNSLDEIPQLINVLRGEMSLVGPRPLPDYETARIEKSKHRRRLSVKPGLTGLWQIRGRNQISNFDDWCQHDLEYIDQCSLLLDFLILLRTVPAVLSRHGAR